jgi:hypothetical protein
VELSTCKARQGRSNKWYAAHSRAALNEEPQRAAGMPPPHLERTFMGKIKELLLDEQTPNKMDEPCWLTHVWCHDCGGVEPEDCVCGEPESGAEV